MTPCEEKFQIQVWLGFGLVLHFVIIFVSFVVQKQDPPESSGVSCFSLRQTETCTPQCATGYVAKVDGDADGLLYCFEKVLTPTTFRCAWSNSSMGEDQERERERDDNKNWWTAGIRFFSLYHERSHSQTDRDCHDGWSDLPAAQPLSIFAPSRPELGCFFCALHHLPRYW